MSLGRLKRTVPAIIAANYGGEMGSVALADVLFGDYNPSGKLAATMYPPNYVDEIGLNEMGLTVGPGRTHMFYRDTPEFPFGAGLSYTDWTFKWADSSATTGAPEPVVYSISALNGEEKNPLHVHVHNVGMRAGRHTVLMFWRPKAGTKLARKLKLVQKLVGYAGTGELVHPGQNKTLEFSLAPETLSIVPDGTLTTEKILHPGEYEIFIPDGTGSNVALIRTVKVIE